MTARTLVAGVGNVFLGDDGFGVEVARRLHGATPDHVDVVDFGIRGMDLVYAMLDGYDRVIIVDALPRGGAPGTLYLVAPGADDIVRTAPGVGAHGILPHQALATAAALGARPASVRIVGCEPGRIPGDGEVEVGLSAPVSAAVDGAVAQVLELVTGA